MASTTTAVAQYNSLQQYQQQQRQYQEQQRQYQEQQQRQYGAYLQQQRQLEEQRRQQQMYEQSQRQFQAQQDALRRQQLDQQRLMEESRRSLEQTDRLLSEQQQQRNRIEEQRRIQERNRQWHEAHQDQAADEPAGGQEPLVPKAAPATVPTVRLDGQPSISQRWQDAELRRRQTLPNLFATRESISRQIRQLAGERLEARRAGSISERFDQLLAARRK